jgi:putative Mg2+ transporter-C (MgtC) family protein
MPDMDLFGWPDPGGLVRVVLRLGSAATLGGLIGLERQWAGKAAGIRTHMMVALGAAVFVLVPTLVGTESGDLSRVIQGIAAGIGFLGGGTILKNSSDREIEGLTSAATIWFTGAIGIAAGVGQIWLAIFGVASAWAVLLIALRLDRWVNEHRRG